jgi:hypothetical protein
VNYLGFDPHLARERRRQMLGEVDSLRLKKRLRDDPKSSDPRFSALARRGALLLLSGAGPTK